MEKHELIVRKAYPVVPPKVEYTISAKGRKAIPVIEVIRDYGLSLMKQNGLSEEAIGKKKVPSKKKV